MHRATLFGLALAAGVTTNLRAQELIPRELLFGNPERAAPVLSPNGAYLAFLAPVRGVMNVWVAPRGNLAAAKPVTGDTGRGITEFFWAHTNQHLVYLQDKNGDENYRAYSLNTATGRVVELTPVDGVRAQVQEVSPKHPTEVLIGLNDRNPQLHDTWRVNLVSGERKLVLENPGFVGVTTDDELNVRFAMAMQPDGAVAVLRRDGEQWLPFITIPQEDLLTSSMLGFTKDLRQVYLVDSRGRDTAALTLLSIADGRQTVLAEDARADVASVMLHPTERTLQAWSSTYTRTDWRAVDPEVAADLAYLRQACGGDIAISSRSLDDRRWVVTDYAADGPVRWYLYERDAARPSGRRIGGPGRRVADSEGPGRLTYLFCNRPELEQLTLAPMHAPVVRSRDGLDLVCYLTLPVGSDPDGDGRPDRPLPTVLWIHGGPWARDSWGYNPVHQWLANRGYAVMSINYRGSTGYGKRFLNASDREWGGKMHDDLIDVVDWMVAQKIANPAQVAISGGSYGGYATLVGLTFTPDVFACGVDLVGPSNLVTFLQTVPAYWKPLLDIFYRRIGDPTTEEGRAFLLSRSPISKLDQLRRPLLIGQGANDPRVNRAESDQVVAALRQRNVPVTYLLYPDEGHGFARQENNLSFFAAAEAFLAQYLGGRVEPIGDDFQGSSVQVLQGGEHVPGLSAATGR